MTDITLRIIDAQFVDAGDARLTRQIFRADSVVAVKKALPSKGLRDTSAHPIRFS
ncbi:MAG TPA: hypothetical protein VN043_06460 [Rhodanobacter sp.]|nr:hypothetical protein [Rhodanobacter sp.]